MERYNTANAALDSFLPLWHRAQSDYRARLIGDAEFAPMQDRRKALLAEFDAADAAWVR